ncbi:MAG: peptidase [Anaerocolumna sp.]|jgi:predicted acyl esterase|nr:peptidase [Anaerocolumna sp.]
MEEDKYFKTEERDNMKILWNIPIVMSDGITLRADVFLPIEEGTYPAIMTYGLYGKGQQFQVHYEGPWNRMIEDFPGIIEGTTNKYQNWETSDPERFVPHGYALIRVDSRGAGWSEGIQHTWSYQEIKDFYECIEWAALEPWCNGNVGLLGISYYAANHWAVAAMQPPHLKAIIPWEGTSDWYRELYYHGGIRCTFLDSWAKKQTGVQYGYGERGRKNSFTGEWVAGPITLSEEVLEKNRIDVVKEIKEHPLKDSYYDGVTVDWSKVTVPILSSANWGGAGLHLRGNIEGFLQAASENKWLEVHGYEHWTHYYTPYGVDLQKRFLDYFLKGEDNGWDNEPKVRINTRHINNVFTEKTYDQWPLPNTNWTTYYLDATNNVLEQNIDLVENSKVSYQPFSNNVTFRLPVAENEIEFTGPVASKLYISSLTSDADLFLTIRLFSSENEEIAFRGAMDAHAPIAQGWLRASLRKLDIQQSLKYRPYYAFDTKEPLIPGEIYEVEVEIWPTSIVIPKGYQLALTIGGKDYEYEGAVNEESKKYHRYPSLGCGPFLHGDRTEDIYGGEVTIYTGKKYPSYLLMPYIPN